MFCFSGYKFEGLKRMKDVDFHVLLSISIFNNIYSEMLFLVVGDFMFEFLSVFKIYL